MYRRLGKAHTRKPAPPHDHWHSSVDSFVLSLSLSVSDQPTTQPAFLALSGTVITLNGIVGGALVAVSALVNGLFIAIAAGIAYLGRLASDKEREQAGGPMGPKTFEISKLLEILRRFLDNNPPAPGEQ